MAHFLDSAPYFTVLVPVEAEVFPLEGDNYFTWLTPGVYYAAQDATRETLLAGPLTDALEMYFVCIILPDEWHRFVFADDTSKLPLCAPTLD